MPTATCWNCLPEPDGKGPTVTTPAPFILFVCIGLAAGVASGLFGIGGGVLIVPALIYLAGFSEHSAIGTSLAVLLPPVGLGAVIEYYRQGQVDLPAALIMAVALLLGGWIGALLANQLSGPHLRLGFGLFLLGLGCYVVFGAVQSLAHSG
nr:sulfite exporter TauE/SafE family protein [Methylogaea oryzae]